MKLEKFIEGSINVMAVFLIIIFLILMLIASPYLLIRDWIKKEKNEDT